MSKNIVQLQIDICELQQWHGNPAVITQMQMNLVQVQQSQLQQIAQQQQIAQNNFYISPLTQYQEKPGDIIPFKKYPGDTQIHEEDIIFKKLMKMTYEDMINGAMEAL